MGLNVDVCFLPEFVLRECTDHRPWLKLEHLLFRDKRVGQVPASIEQGPICPRRSHPTFAIF